MTHLVERIAGYVSGRSRRRKYAEFIETLKPSGDDTIIDVGVNDREYSANDNYLEKHYPHPERITAVSQQSLDYFRARYPKVTAVIGDGLKLPFPDRNFDIVFSNAVIEHVGDRDRQLLFIRELRRVAGRGYMTTPNRHFPIEVHTRIPLLHLLLPKRWFDRFLAVIGKGWAAGDYMHLLSRRDLESLLKAAAIDNYRITATRIAGIPLTYTVTWSK
jgi:SAM-dependent methyltransferase